MVSRALVSMFYLDGTYYEISMVFETFSKLVGIVDLMKREYARIHFNKKKLIWIQDLKLS